MSKNRLDQLAELIAKADELKTQLGETVTQLEILMGTDPDDTEYGWDDAASVTQQASRLFHRIKEAEKEVNSWLTP